MSALAVVRIRGDVNLSEEERNTLRRLRLTRVNHCVIVPENQKKMVQKVNDYVTWGEINAETLKELIVKRGEVKGGRVTEDYIMEKTGKNLDEFVNLVINGEITLTKVGVKPFRLHPPSKGYERGGIKKHFSVGGALGYRGEKINELIRRMM